MFNTETYLEGRIHQLENWVAQLETGALFLVDHPAAGVNIRKELGEALARLAECKEHKRREAAQEARWAADNTNTADWLAEYV